MFGFFIWEKNAVVIFLDIKCTQSMDRNDHNVFNRYRMRFSTLQFSGYSIRTDQYHNIVKMKVQLTVNSNGQSVINRNPD